MKPELTKGNEAIVKAAILAGCRAYYGYPITPASEIAEAAALYFPRVGGVFIQAESETASVNMLYGGASAGVRCMSGSSGPGISLMQEGMSYLAGAELPCVIADIMRGTGRYNLAQGAVATVQGIGASLSGLLAGVIVDRYGYAAAFLGLGAAAALALIVFAVGMPETANRAQPGKPRPP